MTLINNDVMCTHCYGQLFVVFYPLVYAQVSVCVCVCMSVRVCVCQYLHVILTYFRYLNERERKCIVMLMNFKK